MERKTGHVISITTILLFVILGISIYLDDMEFSGIIIIPVILLIISTLHYFLFIKDKQSEAIWNKQRGIRSTYGWIMILMVLMLIYMGYTISIQYLETKDYQQFLVEETKIQDKQIIEDQKTYDISVTKIAGLLGINSNSIAMIKKGDYTIMSGGYISVKTGGFNYTMGLTTGLQDNYSFMVKSKSGSSELLEVIATSKDSPSNYCDKIKIDNSLKFDSLLYNFAPQCLTTCEKLQQVIIKGGNSLSKNDLEKISPACAESFDQ